MSSKEDYLLRPVISGMCNYESLKNGSIDLLDIAKMNEALDIQAQNNFIMRNQK